MRVKVFIAAIVSVVSMITIGAQSQKAPSGSVEISFSYKKKFGFASNQFAVWIEDAKGKYVRSLYATSFTADGGYKRRPNSLPLWVKQSNLAGLSKDQIDAISGATPRAGMLTYRWDGTDAKGAAVTAGEYRLILEATLRNENAVIYSVPVKLGASGEVKPEPKYLGNSTDDRNMISDVVVKCSK